MKVSVLNNEEYQFLKNMLYVHGVSIHVFEAPYAVLDLFDIGLRKSLYLDYDYKQVEQKLRAYCHNEVIYKVRDIFGVHYIVLANQDDENNVVYMIVGPYLEQNDKPSPEEIVKKNNMELYHNTVLKEYYNSLPLCVDIESTMFTFMNYFAKEGRFRMDYLELEFGEHRDGIEFQIDAQNDFAMELIEERYQVEDALLQAIEDGDQTRAMLAMNEIGKFRMEARTNDYLRNYQNMMLTLNVLFRKSVQQARVHPAHIDSVSTAFARRIEVSRNRTELSRLMGEMIRKYCNLVQSYSLKGYSELVENVINWVEFNIQEPLGLKDLAMKFSVNASYLSGQFKRETGETLTNYINGRRIQRSLYYLTTTRLSIQEIAVKVGIYDENYFSRIFKRAKNMTPREYRNRLK